MTPLFDRDKIRKNRLIARKHIEGHDFLFQKAAERIRDNLGDIQREFKDILIIGERGENFLNIKNKTLFDLDESLNETPLGEPETYDCIICLPYLHTVNDVPRFLMAVKTMLKPDGLFLCAFFGGQSLQELRASIMEAELAKTGGVSNHIHPMIDHYQAAALMQKAGFALPVVDYDRVTVTYQKLQSLYDDLYYMGEANALSNRTQNFKNMKQDIENEYKNRFYNGGFQATFDIIHMIGWAPHESQQQPAKRGSGQTSLTEIL